MTFSVSRSLSAAAVAAALAGTALPAAADAAADEVADLKRQLAQSAKQIEALAARLEALEAASRGRSETASAKPAEAPQPAGRMEALEQEVGQLRDSLARGNQDTGLPVHGFADVGVRASGDAGRTGQQSGATVGTFDLYLTPQIGDRIRSLFELGYEFDHADGTSGVDIERAQIGYVFNDHLTTWVGRFHTPYGYWNTAFHHGAQLQLAITRPAFLEFEDKGGVLPAHSVGVWATGAAPLGQGKALYDLYAANGSRIAGGSIDFNAVHDDNSNKAVGARLSYQFGGSLDGLTAGLHGLTEEVDVYGSPAYQNGTSNPVVTNPGFPRTRLDMSGAYAVYDADDWEAIAEYYHFGNKDLAPATTGTHSSWAGFLQIGRAITPRWVPYVRYEKASFDQTDSYFAALAQGGQSYSRGVLGLRYNLNGKAAIKVEANRTKQTDAPIQEYNEIRAQYSIRF